MGGVNERLGMKRVWVVGALLVMLAGGGFGYQALVAGEAQSQAAPSTHHGMPAVPVVVATAKIQATPVQFDAVGTVQTIASVAVKSRVDGEVAKVLVKDGQEVKAGDPIILIDPRFAQAQLDQSRANLLKDRAVQTNAFRDVKRYQPLAQQQYVSRQQLDTSTTTAQSATAAVEADEAAVESAAVTLSYFTIKAAIDGRIGFVNQKIGNDVKASDVPLATINQIKPIYLSFPLPQSELPRLRRAMAAGPVMVRAMPFGDQATSETGRLTFFENSVDASTGTIMVRATFENPRESLWPGQFCNVTVDVAVENDALTVPAAAVQVGQSGDYVYVITPDNKAEYRSVTLSRTLHGVAVIAKGLKVGERVATDGILRITNGSRVAIRGTEEVRRPGQSS